MTQDPTTSTIPAAQLREWREACERATPGPWENVYKTERNEEDAEAYCVDFNGKRLFDTLNSDIKEVDYTEGGDWFDVTGRRNMKFCALSRTALPRLLSAYESAQAEIAELEATVDCCTRDVAIIHRLSNEADEAHANRVRRLESALAAANARADKEKLRADKAEAAMRIPKADDITGDHTELDANDCARFVEGANWMRDWMRDRFRAILASEAALDALRGKEGRNGDDANG